MGSLRGVMRSADAGENWDVVLRVSELASEPGVIHSVLLDGDCLYAVGGTVGSDPMGELAFFHSGDRGRTWTTVEVPPDVSAAGEAVLDSEGRLLVGTFADGAWRFRP